jgi:hypothetical protein
VNEPDRPSLLASGGFGGSERTDSLEERFDLFVVVGRSVVESVLWDAGRDGSCETDRFVLRFARIWAQ